MFRDLHPYSVVLASTFRLAISITPQKASQAASLSRYSVAVEESNLNLAVAKWVKIAFKEHLGTERGTVQPVWRTLTRASDRWWSTVRLSTCGQTYTGCTC